MKKYTDRTVMTWGKYRYSPLTNVPPQFLLELYETKKTDDRELLIYIENNLDRLKRRANAPLPIERRVRGKTIRVVCRDSDKVVYASEKIAKSEIRRIQNLEQDFKKPVRSYECQKCGGWHLTSIPFEEWEKIKPSQTHKADAYPKELIKHYETETQQLNNKLNYREQQIKLLKEENDSLRESNKQLKEENKQLNDELRIDKRILWLEKELYDRRKEVETLKHSNSQLINRLFLLEKRNNHHRSNDNQ